MSTTCFNFSKRDREGGLEKETEIVAEGTMRTEQEWGGQGMPSSCTVLVISSLPMAATAF